MKIEGCEGCCLVFGRYCIFLDNDQLGTHLLYFTIRLL